LWAGSAALEARQLHHALLDVLEPDAQGPILGAAGLLHDGHSASPEAFLRPRAFLGLEAGAR